MEMLCRMEIRIDWNPATLSCKWLSLPPDLSGSADPSVRGWASDRMERMQKRVGHKPQLALTGDTETKLRKNGQKTQVWGPCADRGQPAWAPALVRIHNMAGKVKLGPEDVCSAVSDLDTHQS